MKSMDTQQDFEISSRLAMMRAGCLALLMVLLAACSFGLGAGESSAPTATPAGDLVATIQADVMATLQAKQTQDAVQVAAQVPPTTPPQSLDTQATIQAMQAMLDAQATALAAPAAVQPTLPVPVQVIPTLAPAGGLEPIQIDNWAVEFWTKTPYGCEGFAPCWLTNDDFVKHFGGNLLLTSRQSYFIDPAWPNPYLVFRDLRENQAEGLVEALIDGKPNTLQIIPKGMKSWSIQAIPLSRVAGKKVFFRFMVPGRMDSNENKNGGVSPSTHWFVAQMQLVPNYQP